MERLLQASAAHERERMAERDAAFLQRMNRQIAAGAGAKPKRGRSIWTATPSPEVRRRALPLAVAAALLIAVGLTILLYLGNNRPSDGLLYSEGVVSAVAADDGTRIAAEDGTRFVYALQGSRVMLFADTSTHLLVLDESRIRLERGEVWVHVETGHRGFAVETTDGTATVEGTLFSVARTHRTTVRVARGSIRVATPDAIAALSAGDSATFGDDLAELVCDEGVGDPPEWVWDLADRATGTDWREVYPSGSPH